MPTIASRGKDIQKLFPKLLRVKYRDIFNLMEFYKALRYWFAEYGWQGEDMNGKPDKDYFETLYLEITKPDGGKEMRIEWRLSRQAPNSAGKIKQYIDVNFQMFGISKTEVIRNGVKYRANKGEIEFKMNAFMEKTYEAAWKKHWLLKHVMTFFDKEVYDWLEDEKQLYQEVYVLQNFVKQWFKMKRYQPYEEAKPFHEGLAWPSHHKEE